MAENQIERSYEDDLRECYQVVFEGMRERGKPGMWTRAFLEYFIGQEFDGRKQIVKKRILGEVAAEFGVKS
jgi:hypothetical protein